MTDLAGQCDLSSQNSTRVRGGRGFVACPGLKTAASRGRFSRTHTPDDRQVFPTLPA